MDAAKRCFDLLFRDSSDHENYLQVAMGAVAQLCNVIDFQVGCSLKIRNRSYLSINNSS